MNGANKKSEAELGQLYQVFLFNLQFIIAVIFLLAQNERLLAINVYLLHESHFPLVLCGIESEYLPALRSHE